MKCFEVNMMECDYCGCDENHIEKAYALASNRLLKSLLNREVGYYDITNMIVTGKQLENFDKEAYAKGKADRTDAVMTGAEGFKRGWNEGETHTCQKADDAFRAVFDKVDKSRKAHKNGCVCPTCNPTITALYAEFIGELHASESLGTAQSGASLSR
jgi:hypothetical protein